MKKNSEAIYGSVSGPVDEYAVRPGGLPSRVTRFICMCSSGGLFL